MRKGSMQWQRDCPYGSHAGCYVKANTREMEQRDLTYELHDTVIQPLTALLISFAQIERQLSGGGHIETHLGMWKGLAQEALDALRSSLADMRTPAHRTDDLLSSLRFALVPQCNAQGLRLILESRDWPDDLPPHWNSHLYLALREAVTNVQKHARASEVSILLHADPDTIAIRIRDNGVGFSQADCASERRMRAGYGLGINSMRDRVTLLGGHMTLSTAPGSGVQIEIRLPRPGPVKRLAPCTHERGHAEHTIDSDLH